MRGGSLSKGIPEEISQTRIAQSLFSMVAFLEGGRWKLDLVTEAPVQNVDPANQRCAV